MDKRTAALEAKLHRNMGRLKSFIKSQKYIKIAYLFGSAAKRKMSPLSDIDIAFLLDEKLPKSRRADKLLFLISGITDILGTDRVDIVIMNDMDYAFRYEVIKTGKLLFSEEPARVEFETSVMSEYLDRRRYDIRHAEMFVERVSKEGIL